MFGALEILYLFLAGTGAGLCAVASMLGLFSPKERISMVSISAVSSRPTRYAAIVPPYRAFLAPALGVAFACLVVGSLCLVFSLGRFERVLSIFVSSNFSWANFGAIVLMICMVLCAFQALISAGYAVAPLWMLRMVQLLSITASFLVAFYTGMLLYDMTGVPFWHSAFLPVLFVLSSLSCGLAALLVVSVAFRTTKQFQTLILSMLRIDFFLVLAEAIALIGFIAVRSTVGEGQEAVYEAVEALVSGNLSIWFWGVFVGLGLVLPLGVEIGCRFRQPRNLESTSAVLGIAVVLGGMALRYCVIVAAAHPYLGAAVSMV